MWQVQYKHSKFGPDPLPAACSSCTRGRIFVWSISDFRGDRKQELLTPAYNITAFFSHVFSRWILGFGKSSHGNSKNTKSWFATVLVNRWAWNAFWSPDIPELRCFAIPGKTGFPQIVETRCDHCTSRCTATVFHLVPVLRGCDLRPGQFYFAWQERIIYVEFLYFGADF